jgi:ribosome-binding protein aMBF1 (putative translation factor)
MEHQNWETVVLSKKEKVDKQQKQRETSQRGEREGKLEGPPNLGQLIANARNFKQMTRKILAGKLKIAPTVMARIEIGKEIPSNAQIVQFERALCVKLPRVKKVAYTD